MWLSSDEKCRTARIMSFLIVSRVPRVSRGLDDKRDYFEVSIAKKKMQETRESINCELSPSGLVLRGFSHSTYYSCTPREENQLQNFAPRPPTA